MSLTFRLVRPAVARLGLFSLLVVGRDAWEALIVLAVAALLFSSGACLRGGEEGPGISWVATKGGSLCCGVAWLRDSSNVL